MRTALLLALMAAACTTIQPVEFAGNRLVDAKKLYRIHMPEGQYRCIQSDPDDCCATPEAFESYCAPEITKQAIR